MPEKILKDTILLAGSGRSGTTWLGNIVASDPMVQVVFEPFDGRRVPAATPLPLRPYARPRGRYDEWEALVERILRGEIQNDWTRREGRRWWANKRLIKTIRASLMLGWISDRFHPRVVYLMRHPCAVVLSRLKLGWETHVDVLLAQRQLVEDHLAPFLDLIEGAETAIARHTVMWAVENLVALRQMQGRDWVFCTYEQLCTEPQAEAERILRALDLRRTWLVKGAIDRISMSRPGSAVRAQRDPLSEWQRQLSSEDIDLILGLVSAFGIDFYGSGVMPRRDPGGP